MRVLSLFMLTVWLLFGIVFICPDGLKIVNMAFTASAPNAVTRKIITQSSAAPVRQAPKGRPASLGKTIQPGRAVLNLTAMGILKLTTQNIHGRERAVMFAKT